MKSLSIMILSVCAFTFGAYAQESSCHLVQNVARTHLTEQLDNIKGRVSHDSSLILSSPSMVDAITNNRYVGSFNRWYPGELEQDGNKTSINLYVAGDLFPPQTVMAWSTAENWGEQDKSKDVIEMTEMINSIRKANGLSKIKIMGVTFQQTVENGPFQLDEVQVIEESGSGRNVKSVEDLVNRYMLPEFCVTRYVLDLPINNSLRGSSSLSDRNDSNDSSSRASSSAAQQ